MAVDFKHIDTPFMREYIEIEDSTAEPVYNLLKAKTAFCHRYMPELLPEKQEQEKASDFLKDW